MNIGLFEQEVFDKEEIRIVVRGSYRANVGDYEYERRAADNTSIASWLDTRIKPLLQVGDIHYEVVVVDGSGRIPHGKSKLSTVRGSYQA